MACGMHRATTKGDVRRSLAPPGHAGHFAPRTTLDRSLAVFFWNGLRVTLTRPRQAWQFLRTVRWQAAAVKTRLEWQRRDLRVPPIVIFSITHQCNLTCAGCYARSFQIPFEQPSLGDGLLSGDTNALNELSESRLGSIVAEANDLGVSFLVIAGGEPLMRPEILDIAERFPHMLFLLLTNGVLVGPETIHRLTRLRNVVSMLSLEGTATETDGRRGEGTYRRLMDVMGCLNEERVFFGCSLTLTSANFSIVLDESYIRGLVKAGCRFFLLLDYTPTEEKTEGWVLTDEQRGQVTSRMRFLRKRYPALFIAVPWDELSVGGCLSSGRGFVHINASGDLEPCPFAPYSDVNLKEVSLMQALRSPFLADLRAMPELAQYSGGGCALWKNREQVERVLAAARQGGVGVQDRCGG
jgi:MoaA/NifB/PqqE/SkfB family radical SAM enzyme